jgi:hypothetical protein
MKKNLLLTAAAISLAIICPVATNAASAKDTETVSQVAINESNETIIDLTESSDHLLDFSNMNKEVVGIAISTPREFAKSFKIQPALGDDQTLTVSSIQGGSNTQRVMLVTADDDGHYHYQPILIRKQFSEKKVTQFYDQPEETVAKVAPYTSQLLKGAKAANETTAIDDPELQGRVQELVEASKSGEDPYKAAETIGLSRRYVARLIQMGSE